MSPWSYSFKINISNDRERYREECRKNFMTNNQLQMSRSLPWNRSKVNHILSWTVMYKMSDCPRGSQTLKIAPDNQNPQDNQIPKDNQTSSLVIFGDF